MKLILIRHGKAEHSFGKRDFERELTAAGKKDLRRKAARLVQKLQSESEIEKSAVICLTSPAIRAEQTTAILAEELSERTGVELSSEERQDIYFGDETPILDDIAAMPDDTIVLWVGHQPTLSYLASRISDIAVPFGTGDMVCFAVTEKKPLRGELLWRIGDE